MGSGSVFAVRRRPSFLSRKSVGDVIFDFLNYTFLVVFSLSIIYPFWTTILLSFSDMSEATSLGFHLWIQKWSLEAYRFSLSRYGHVPTAYVNSIIRTVVGTILTLIIALLGAYPLSKRELPGRNIVTFYILITMFFGGGLIPTYLLIRSLGLFDSRLALVLPGLAGGFNIIIMRNFLMTIDRALEESAFIDGANYFQILNQIIIPLSKPVIATIALWTAVHHWNAWFDALIYLKSESKIVLQLLLRRLIQEMSMLTEMNSYMALERIQIPSEAVKAAITILTIGPIVLTYPFLQKHFIKGIFLGSLKG